MTNYLVSECAIHGTKETSDYSSLIVYVESALACALDAEVNVRHDESHTEDECWVCCPEMVIDPYGYLDY